ncbi:hypothetical protein JCM10908_006419 [Rhodotorula pacifica]|uniref:M50 family metallopeptidase n=1 Tax=Rhodotorula pacifica TaxID=1495444 RepID=UPI00318061EA
MAPAALLLESYLDLVPLRDLSLDKTSRLVSDSSTAPGASPVSPKLVGEALVPRNRRIGQPAPYQEAAQAWSKRDGAVQPSLPASLHKRSTSLAPNYSQKVTLGVIAAYAVIISVLWITPVLKWVLWPFKMLTVAFHEFSHAATGCCTGAKIKSISLDPREGGVTMMAGGIGAITLPAGYLGSSFIGALLIFCGFDITASKVAAIIVGVCFLITLWWSRRDWLTIVTILIATGLIVAFFFIAHGQALRWYMLFLGVMSSLYSVYDILDDLIMRKVNESDASAFAKRYGGSSQCWGVIWGIISLGFMAAGIVAGLAVFKEDFAVQEDMAKSFLPTRF